jgi:hypothetical protein
MRFFSSGDDEELAELGAEAIREIEAADARADQAGADLLAGKISSRDYDAAESASKQARRDSSGILGRLERAARGR